MSDIPQTPEERAKKWSILARWGIFAVVGFLVSPFIMATLTGMLGLLAVCTICGTTYYMLPVIEDKAKNIRLQMIKAEAAKNPIETLENEYLRRQLILGQRKDAIEKFDTKTRTFGDKLDGFKRNYPTDAPKYQQIYDSMMLLLQRQRAQWKEANKNLNLFNGEIDRAKAMYEMALAAAAAKEGSGLDEDAFNARLKTETALNSITDGMNSAFAQLDSLVDESEKTEINVTPAPAQIAAPNDTNVIDIKSVNKHKTV